MLRLAAAIVSRRIRSGGPVGEVDVKGIGRRFRGDLARLGAAHSVGDDEDRGAHEKGILVGAALAPHVGAKRPGRSSSA